MSNPRRIPINPGLEFGDAPMPPDDPSQDYRRAYDVQFRSFREDLLELKDRVRGLEQTLARGVMLLVANLAGMAVSLWQQLAQE